MKPVMNAKDIQEYLGVSQSKAYDMMREKSFPTLKIGGRRLVKSVDFEKWLDEQKQIS